MNGGTYKQFLANRVKKIAEKSYTKWGHINKNENAADLVSCTAMKRTLGELWLSGPKWLQNPDQWPADLKTFATKDTEAEAELLMEALGVVAETNDSLQQG